MRTLPTSVRDSVYDLTPDGQVFLYRITLQNGVIFRLTPQREAVWQSNVYEAIPCVLTEMSVEADGKANRPTFTMVNPDGIFTPFIAAGLLDNADLTRFTLLRDDLENDRDFAVQESMRLAQVLSVSRQLVVCQVRDVTDGQHFSLPARMYIPPEFPHVKL